MNQFIQEARVMSKRFEGQTVGQRTKRYAMTFRSGVVVTLVALAGLTVAGSAAAQAEGGADGEGYGYEFEDDPLNAGGFGPNDATIRVRPKAARTTLIRPRTTFVPEMLKSVENL
jgi:hypothetical protein